MRLMLVTTLFCFGLAGSLSAQAPQMNNVQPNEGKVGSVLRIHGVFLGKAKVDEVYLTDHTFDMKVKVLDQQDDAIEFRIPPSVKPGRLQLSGEDSRQAAAAAGATCLHHGARAQRKYRDRRVVEVRLWRLRIEPQSEFLLQHSLR